MKAIAAVMIGGLSVILGVRVGAENATNAILRERIRNDFYDGTNRVYSLEKLTDGQSTEITRTFWHQGEPILILTDDDGTRAQHFSPDGGIRVAIRDADHDTQEDTIIFYKDRSVVVAQYTKKTDRDWLPSQYATNQLTGWAEINTTGNWVRTSGSRLSGTRGGFPQPQP